MGKGKIFGAETSGLKQGDRQSITHHQGCGGGRRWCQAQGAGLYLHADIQIGYGFPGQGGIRIAGHADQGRAHPFDQWQNGDHLAGVAAVGNGDNYVLGSNHTHVAVACLAWMNEERRRAGAGQGCGDLVPDVAGLAHAGNHHAARALHNNFTGPGKMIVDTALKSVDGVSLDADGTQGGRSEIGRSLFVHRAWGLAVKTLEMVGGVYHFRPATRPGYRKFSQTDHCYQYILGSLD